MSGLNPSGAEVVVPVPGRPPATATELLPGLWRIEDTCAVYLFLRDGAGICVDFGSGLVLEVAAELGVTISHVLMTHHHRDQGQGLPRAAAAGIEIWVPPVEVELFGDVDRFWQHRRVIDDYDLRTDRFSITTSVPVAGTVPEYRRADFGGFAVRTLPTPGHTHGSVSYLVEHAGRTVACTGDLIYAPGKVWSLASTQWTYTGNEGPMTTMLSALTLRRERPELLLPSHGEMITEPDHALDRLVANLGRYVDSRRPSGSVDLRARLADPFDRLTDHLLINRTSDSCSYVLLSDSGAALVIDFGYDQTSWYPLGGPRATQRPLLASLPALRERYGVTAIEVALPTHYHDDHVAGLNLLRAVEGTKLWIPQNVAPILAEPLRYDLPCQWPEPIPADRVLPLERTVRWREYEIGVHPLPGHTEFAAAYSFDADGVRVLAVGDQQDGLGEPGVRRDLLNYQYRNRLRLTDFADGVRLYRRIAPGLMIAGHWEPRRVEDGYFDRLDAAAAELVEVHRLLLPLEEFRTDPDSVVARLVPYLRTAEPGELIDYRVELINPLPAPAPVHLTPVLPEGWRCVTGELERTLDTGERAELTFTVRVGRVDRPLPYRRVLTVDAVIGDRRLGQLAEALVELHRPGGSDRVGGSDSEGGRDG